MLFNIAVLRYLLCYNCYCCIHFTDSIPNEENAQENDFQYKFLILFEKKVVYRCNSLLKALQLLIATYFTFNKTFPKVHGNILLFIQTYFLNIKTRQGNCRSRSDIFKNKVIALCNSLNKINIQDYEQMP